MKFTVQMEDITNIHLEDIFWLLDEPFVAAPHRNRIVQGKNNLDL